MSAAATIEEAAAGRLPAWAAAGPERRAHMERVAALLDEWAVRLGLSPTERVRWRAAGWLHDALRDAEPAALRPRVPEALRDLPGPVLHGPAAATRLRDEGLEDEALLRAIAYHTLGHPAFDRLGCALYLADVLEPGRSFRPVWRAALRARMPEALDAVLVEVVTERVRHLLRGWRRLRPETVAFWNSLLEDDGPCGGESNFS